VNAGAWSAPRTVSRWGATHLLAVGQLVTWGTLYYSYALLAPALASDLAVNPGVVAMAFSGTLLVSGLLAPLVGRWLDTHGGVVVLRWGSLIGPMSLLVLAGAEGPLAMWGAFLLLGVAQACSLYEPVFRAVVDWFPDPGERAKALVRVTIVGGFASTVFVPATAALLHRLGWRGATMILSLVLAVTALPIGGLLSRRAFHPRSSISIGRARSPLGTAPGLWLGLAFAAHAFAAGAVAVALVWLLVDRGQTLAMAALLTGLAGAAQVPGRLLFAVVQSQIPGSLRVTASLMVQAMAVALVAVGPAGLVVPSVLAFGALSGMLTLERATVVVQWFGAERFGTISGGVSRYTLVARAAAPTVMATIAAAASLRDAFLLVAGTLLAGAIAFAMAAMRHHATDRSRSPHTRSAARVSHPPTDCALR